MVWVDLLSEAMIKIVLGVWRLLPHHEPACEEAGMPKIFNERLDHRFGTYLNRRPAVELMVWCS